MREGNLETPTRHAIDWRSPSFYDEADAFKEMERVFDICHGCRRCVSLCQSFPNLFDLVDATGDGEGNGVKEGRTTGRWSTSATCATCAHDQVPVHAAALWNLDFPHLMLRAKAIRYKRGGVKGGEKFLASTDVHGQFAGIPIVVQAVNAGEQDQVRAQADGLAAGRTRRLDARRWRRAAFPLGRRSRRPPSSPTARTPGRWRSSRHLLRQLQRAGHRPRPAQVLAHNDIPYVIVEEGKCCGMPKLELGDLDAVARTRWPTCRCWRVRDGGAMPSSAPCPVAR